MGFLERVRELFGTTIAIHGMRWPAELDPVDEDDPPVRDADHTGDDPGPERVATGELRPLGSDEE